MAINTYRCLFSLLRFRILNNQSQWKSIIFSAVVVLGLMGVAVVLLVANLHPAWLAIQSVSPQFLHIGIAIPVRGYLAHYIDKLHDNRDGFHNSDEIVFQQRAITP